MFIMSDLLNEYGFNSKSVEDIMSKVEKGYMKTNLFCGKLDNGWYVFIILDGINPIATITQSGLFHFTIEESQL